MTLPRILVDEDEYKPVWPSGLWATSQGGKTYSRQSHAPFIEAFWQSTRSGQVVPVDEVALVYRWFEI